MPPPTPALHRPYAVTAAHGMSCFMCYIRSASGFDSDRGEPLLDSCKWLDPIGFTCTDCKVTGSRCGSVPALLRFDQIRLRELLSWSNGFFGLVFNEDGRPLRGMDGIIICQTSYETRRYFAAAQLRLVSSFAAMMIGHQLQYDLHLPVDAGSQPMVTYEALVHHRQWIRQGQVAPLDVTSTSEERLAYERIVCLRLESRDQGYGAWSAAVRAFMVEMEDICHQVDAMDLWERTRPRLRNEDVLVFPL
ncbi:hypothetical protein F4861DRAFT_543563 [Xylaria intraflava]|nr:hypothetical protein F4861DRAFT_543563 [Xylaria intraflava]